MELDGDFSLLSVSPKLFILPKMPSGVEKEDFTRGAVHRSCEKASFLILSCHATSSGSSFHQLEMEGAKGASRDARCSAGAPASSCQDNFCSHFPPPSDQRLPLRRYGLCSAEIGDRGLRQI